MGGQPGIMSNKLILQFLKEILNARFGGIIERVVLFGSRTNGSALSDSDYDILVIVSTDYDWRLEKEIVSACYQADLKYDIVTDVKVISRKEMNSPRGMQPYILNALEIGYSL